MDGMDALYRWFDANRNSIIQGHDGEQVLLKDNTVVGYYPDIEKALLSAAEKGFTIGEFLVQGCVTEEADTMMYYNQAVSFA